MRRTFHVLTVAALLCALVACGRSSSPDGASGSASSGHVTTPVIKSRAGTIYRQAITVAATGDNQVFQVFEPTQLEEGKSYPLVLQGHGYGGSRETEAPDGSMIARLRDAGYYVISIDERGFGESGGTVRVMDPEYEGQDLIAILDWAENLEGLRRHGDGSMVVGSYGGSYGGMYQFLLAGADPKHRLRVIAPDITPHDLTYALNEGNVVKSGWGLVLVAGGEAGGLTGLPSDPITGLQTLLTRLSEGSPQRQDPTIYETLINAGISNSFTDTGLNFFKYHSVTYFCDGQPAGPQSFILPISVPDQTNPAVVPPNPFPKIDALITQGMMDTLFNFNNGYANYQCLKKLGGDVRLLSHQSGHILPISIASVPPSNGGVLPLPSLPVPSVDLESALDPFYAAINIPEFQGPSGATACGGINVQDANFAWFEEKLQGKSGAVNKVVTTGSDFCMSIADGDAIQVSKIKKGGTNFAINDSTPQLNSLLGVVGSLLGSDVREQLLSVQPFDGFTVPDAGAVVAGIPTVSVHVSALDPSLEMSPCPTPVGVGACDPIFFLGIGYLEAGSSNWKLVDAQLTPIRGFGDHDNVDMNGISIRLKKGDQLGLLIYAFHAQYPITWSRDITVPAATLSGSLQLPILGKGDIVRQGV